MSAQISIFHENSTEKSETKEVDKDYEELSKPIIGLLKINAEQQMLDWGIQYRYNKLYLKGERILLLENKDFRNLRDIIKVDKVSGSVQLLTEIPSNNYYTVVDYVVSDEELDEVCLYLHQKGFITRSILDTPVKSRRVSIDKEIEKLSKKNYSNLPYSPFDAKYDRSNGYSLRDQRGESKLVKLLDDDGSEYYCCINDFIRLNYILPEYFEANLSRYKNKKIALIGKENVISKSSCVSYENGSELNLKEQRDNFFSHSYNSSNLNYDNIKGYKDFMLNVNNICFDYLCVDVAISPKTDLVMVIQDANGQKYNVGVKELSGGFKLYAQPAQGKYIDTSIHALSDIKQNEGAIYIITEDIHNEMMSFYSQVFDELVQNEKEKALASESERAKWEEYFAEIRADKEKRTKLLINKYGQNIGTKIAEKIIEPGMTMEMCKDALGAPTDVQKLKTAQSVIEVWTYKLYYPTRTTKRVMFINKLVDAVEVSERSSVL